MSLSKEEKDKIVKEYALHEGDTGSPEIQIALLTVRITRLTEHFKDHPKDIFSKRGFLKMIQRRRRLLRFLKREDTKRYQALIKKLGLRK